MTSPVVFFDIVKKKKKTGLPLVSYGKFGIDSYVIGQSLFCPAKFLCVSSHSILPDGKFNYYYELSNAEPANSSAAHSYHRKPDCHGFV